MNNRAEDPDDLPFRIPRSHRAVPPGYHLRRAMRRRYREEQRRRDAQQPDIATAHAPAEPAPLAAAAAAAQQPNAAPAPAVPALPPPPAAVAAELFHHVRNDAPQIADAPEAVGHLQAEDEPDPPPGYEASVFDARLHGGPPPQHHEHAAQGAAVYGFYAGGPVGDMIPSPTQAPPCCPFGTLYDHEVQRTLAQGFYINNLERRTEELAAEVRSAQLETQQVRDAQLESQLESRRLQRQLDLANAFHGPVPGLTIAPDAATAANNSREALQLRCPFVRLVGVVFCLLRLLVDGIFQRLCILLGKAAAGIRQGRAQEEAGEDEAGEAEASEAEASNSADQR